VVDTQPEVKPWSWRKRDADFSTKKAEDRFKVVELSMDGKPTPVPTAGDLLPMMGAGQTLSAGIALGHYKMRLGALVQAARDELKRAKEQDGKNAFSVRRSSRGGEKAVLRMPFSAYPAVEETIKAFHEGALAGGLPYKLREAEQAVFAAWHHEVKTGDRVDSEARVRNFARALFDGQTTGNHDKAFCIWWAGLTAAHAYGKRYHAHAGSEQGLAVCRHLAALERGEKEER